MADDLGDLMAYDEPFDVRTTEELLDTASQRIRLTERVRALFALARRTDEPGVLDTYVSLLHRDDADVGVIFHTMTTRQFGIVALLVSSVDAAARDIATAMWAELHEIERADVRWAMHSNGVPFEW